jgi:2-phosphosulfolactate phosphatase
VADFCLKKELNVLIVCAGWHNRMNLEDSLFGGALAERLLDSGKYAANSDSIEMSLALWKAAQSDLQLYLSKSEHVKRLLAHGLDKDISYCLALDTVSVLPIYNKKSKSLEIGNL